MPTTLKYTGADAAIRDIEKLAAGSRAEFAQAAVDTLAARVPEVQRRTPFESGELRDTVRVEGPEINGNRITAAIVAGGGEVDYALYVHEDMEADHPIGEAKFIESVLKEAVPVAPKEIGARVNLDKLLR